MMSLGIVHLLLSLRAQDIALQVGMSGISGFLALAHQQTGTFVQHVVQAVLTTERCGRALTS
jgi:hypothetical protein